ncbi:MAG: glutathione S-transferase family protein [Pseudomonadota bacterium]
MKSLKGLHLYHSGISNCAMRVRITLEEKGLDWTSHHLDLVKGEHLTEDYFGINPNGVVPTLVHDGVVIIESQDIIDYLDQTYAEPPLRPSDPESSSVMHEWMARSSEIHVKAVKTYIYDKKMRHSMKKSDAENERYRTLQTNQELLDFHKKSSESAFSQAELDRAERILDDCFAEANEILGHSHWLAGDQFSLADIAWIPLHFTLEQLAGYDFSRFPNVSDWVGRISERSSFQNGVLKWWPMPLQSVQTQKAG